jgi:hypothetical protein
VIDRTRAFIAVAVVATVAVLALVVGFVAGHAAGSDGSGPEPAATSEPAPGPGPEHGPGRVEDGVPVGFTATEEGALAAAATWLPLLGSGPASENPEGLARLFVDGLDVTGLDEGTRRYSMAPLAGRVRMRTAGEADVELLMEEIEGDWNAGEVEFQIVEVTVPLVWDNVAEDWRLARTDLETRGFDDWPVAADDLVGYRALRPTGGELGGVLVEEVPGE